jgi:hypothetical protein
VADAGFVFVALNQTRTQLALGKMCRHGELSKGSGTTMTIPILFGLHQRYARI